MAANSVEKRAKQRSFVIEEKSCKTSVLCSFVSIGKEEEKIMTQEILSAISGEVYGNAIKLNVR